MVSVGARTFFAGLLVVLLSSPALVTAAGTLDATHPMVSDAGAGPAVDLDLSQVRLGGHQPDAAADDVRFTLTDAASWFGPETYKEDDRFQTRNPDDFENQTVAWTTSLGHAISFLVEVEPAPETALPCDERFDAETYIETGTAAGRLYGWTNGSIANDPTGILSCQGVAGTRVFNVTFDLDGAPASTRGSVYYALAGGRPYTAVLDLYYSETPSPSNPTGRGPLAGSYQITFGMASPSIGLGPERTLQRFPDGTLRLFADVGAGTQFAMPVEPYNTSENVTFDMTFSGVPTGTTYDLVGHFAQRLAGGGVERPFTPPGPIAPAAGTVDKVATTEDRTIQVTSVRFGVDNDTVPESRAHEQSYRASDFAQGGDYTPLYAVTLHTPATMDNLVTGASSVVVPIVSSTFPYREIQAQPGTGPVGASTQVRLQDTARVSGGETGSDAGDLFAFRSLAGVSHIELARTTLERTGDDRWIRGAIDHRAFTENPEPIPSPDPVGAYDILAMVYGDDDAFYGLSFARRGVDLATDPVQLVEGRSGELPIRVTSLSTDFDDTPGEQDYAMPITVQVTGLPEGRMHTLNVTLAEGGVQVLRVPLTAPEPGVFTLEVTATSGELQKSLEVALDVMSTEEAAELERKWYDVPATPLPLVALALVALAAILRARRD